MRKSIKLGLAGLLLAGAVAVYPLFTKQTREGILEKDLVVSSRPYDSLTDANKALRDFPDEIPGAKNIDKYEVAGANKCLVNIAQRHMVSGAFDGYEGWSTKPDDNKIDSYVKTGVNQKNIFGIFSYLSKKGLVRSVRGDGIFKDNVDYKRIFELNYTEVLFQTGLYGKPSKYHDIIYYSTGAGYLLDMEGVLKLKKGDDNKLNLSSILAIKERDFKKLKVLTEKREDFLVQLASEDNGPLTYSLFGFLHEFRDNIFRWNDEHPSNKFSYICITPKD